MFDLHTGQLKWTLQLSYTQRHDIDQIMYPSDPTLNTNLNIVFCGSNEFGGNSHFTLFDMRGGSAKFYIDNERTCCFWMLHAFDNFIITQTKPSRYISMRKITKFDLRTGRAEDNAILTHSDFCAYGAKVVNGTRYLHIPCLLHKPVFLETVFGVIQDAPLLLHLDTFSFVNFNDFYSNCYL